MIKKHRTILLFVVIFIFLSSSLAMGKTPKVYDNAKLFTEVELQELEVMAVELSEKLSLDLVIVTITDNKGKTSRQFADDYYDENGFGYGNDADGALLLINMADREVYISTTGIAIKYLTDERIEKILDRIFDYIPNGNYGDAAKVFLTQVDSYVRIGIPSNQYTYDEDTNKIIKDEPTLAQQLMMYFLIASVIGGISVAVMVSLNKGRTSTNKHTYLDRKSFNLINSYDRHVNTQQTFVVIKKDPPSGGSSAGGSTGRSTVHRSSSGRSHGGGGRKF